MFYSEIDAEALVKMSSPESDIISSKQIATSMPSGVIKFSCSLKITI